MDNPFQSPTIISLCSGMLGLEEGIYRVLAGSRTIVHVEIESFVIENLVQQMEQGVLDPTPIWSNLKTFPFADFYRKAHWLVGGYPCQPFSHAGLRGGTEDPRHLYPFISRGIKKSRPMGVYFENVEGHLSLGLRDVCKDLRKLGYQVEVGLFSAAEVGAPHRRNRVFILGLENSFLIRMRGWSDEQRENWRRQIQTPRSGELDCPNGKLGDTQHPGSQREDAVHQSAQFTKSGLLEISGLAHPDVIGQQQFERIFGEIRERAQHGSKDVGDTAIEHAGSRTREDGQVESGGSGVADAAVIGVEGDWPEGVEVTEISTGETISGCHSGGDRWEGAKQSEGELRLRSQLDNNGGQISDGEMSKLQNDQVGHGDFPGWPARPGEEQYSYEPPRLEPIVGYVVARYNYREDLLRMAGNAVVPQQAEKAFRTLLLKFIK